MPLDATTVTLCRAQFPALSRIVDGRAAVYFDGPAGSQVPQRVIDAIAGYLSQCNANHDGLFATAEQSDALLAEAHQACADLVGADDPGTIAFGPNMTTLTFALSRALARHWQPGDEVMVTRLDHDANVTPWILAARDAGASVLHVDIRREDCTLDLDDLRGKLSDRTKLVAVGCASNATGTINPVQDICRWARDVGAMTFLDAVHYAPHALVDVQQFGCDFLACSAYKFFGPHVGVMWGRRALLDKLDAYKLRPAPDTLPGKWMTGTQNHEGIVGTLAAVDYLADLGRALAQDAQRPRRDALAVAYEAIGQYERELARHLLDGLRSIPDITVWGINDSARLHERFPTVSITHRRRSPAELAQSLGQRGVFVWNGNYYALPLTEALGLEPEGMVRIGLLHYNTPAEIDYLLELLRQL
jgi:cysteine desulfurase family protein (TIGR01976 family)